MDLMGIISRYEELIARQKERNHTMATALQQQTSRENGSKSLGPKTEDGKKIVSRNALKHGLTAKTIAAATCLLSTEDQAEFNQLHLDLYTELHPTSPLQRLLVDRLVLAEWKLQRISWMEATTIEADRYEEDPATGEIIDRGLEQSFLNNFPKLTTLHRYEARLQREFRWCLKELQRLQENTPAFPPPKSTKQTRHQKDMTDAEFDMLCASMPPGFFSGMHQSAQTNPIHQQIQNPTHKNQLKSPPISPQ